MMKKFRTEGGFTFIEILVALAIIAALFIPAIQLFSHTLYSTVGSQELITATNLAKWEMERIKNLNFTEAQFKESGDSVYPAKDEEPILMNNARWRIKREVVQDSDPLEIRVRIFLEGKPDKPVITLVTLIEDTVWKEIRPI